MKPIHQKIQTLPLFTDAAPIVEGVLHFDGSCWPNPGPNARCGFILRTGNRLIEKTVPLGQGTNNIAEYQGLICGLRAAVEAGVTHLEVYGDSQLVIRGMKHGPSPKGMPHIEALKREAADAARGPVSVEYIWVPREQNTEADELSTRTVEVR